PLYYTIPSTLFGAIFCYILLLSSTDAHSSETDDNAKVNPKSSCSYKVYNLPGYQFVSPIVSATEECEAAELSPIKEMVGGYIDQEKQSGSINNASVYIRALKNGEWASINPEMGYHPGSLIKLPMLMTFLHMAEVEPSLLNKEVIYNKSEVSPMKQTYETASIQVGHKYTIKDLLHYMIAYSDNSATQLLARFMNIDVTNKLFTDLGLTPPSNDSNYFNYRINAKDYSTFMESLYNASYLTIPASEYATSLLAACNFKNGMMRELPGNVRVAHKFGEAGNGMDHELHESGIVYLNDRPYLITIMTHGNDVQKLSDVISHISKMVYDKMSGPNI
ncbi:MAG: serine hydrolase, partial [Bacteroidota bacterium]